MKGSRTCLNYFSTVPSIIPQLLLKNNYTSEILPKAATPAEIQLSNLNLPITKDTDEFRGLHQKQYVQGSGTHKRQNEVIFTLATIASLHVWEGGGSAYASQVTGSAEMFNCCTFESAKPVPGAAGYY
ncbi:hypothetical protein H8E88_09465 [candidate division KSB1 bacterium]|nr:hypothetical protein [candidate division KSB1 bacterium]